MYAFWLLAGAFGDLMHAALLPAPDLAKVRAPAIPVECPDPVSSPAPRGGLALTFPTRPCHWRPP